MKKALTLALCLLLILGALPAARGLEIIVGGIIYDALTATPTPVPATPQPTLNIGISPGSISLLTPKIVLPTPTPKPTLNIDIPPGAFDLSTPSIKLPTATPKPADPATKAPAPAATPKPAPAATPKPTAKPAAPKPPSGSLKGATLTSFGLYIEDFRPKLTDEWYMFTPINLNQEGVLTYPLVAENAWIVGSVTFTVKGGTLTLDYEAIKGVSITREFMTVVGTLDDLQTVNPKLLAPINLPFRQAINIEATFGSDRLVVLYLNHSADFKTSQAGVTAFVPEQHQLFMQNMVGLVD